MKDIKIGINGERLLIDNPAGPEIYTYKLIQALSKIDSENQYVIYFNKQPSESFFADLTSSNPNFAYKVVKKFISWTQFSLALELLFHSVDVFFTAVHTMPLIKNPRTKVVSMIHGLEYSYSKGYENPINKLILTWPVWCVSKFSNKLIVPSLFTKNELLKKNWRVGENKITVIPEGVDGRFHKYSDSEIEPILKRYNPDKSPYLLFVSTIQPRKNIPLTIKGFSLALSENPELKNVKLLISGKLGWNYEESLSAPKKYNIEKNAIFLGRVSDEDMPVLMSGAKGFINVSLEEGFGLMFLEAMASEVPCVVSDIEAFKTLGLDYPVYVDPRDFQSIKKGVIEVLTAYDKKKIRMAKIHSTKFSWEDTARATLNVIMSSQEPLK